MAFRAVSLRDVKGRYSIFILTDDEDSVDYPIAFLNCLFELSAKESVWPDSFFHFEAFLKDTHIAVEERGAIVHFADGMRAHCEEALGVVGIGPVLHLFDVARTILLFAGVELVRRRHVLSFDPDLGLRFRLGGLVELYLHHSG